MNEADRIKRELKKAKYKDVISYSCIIIFLALVICYFIISPSTKYTPDPSLYVNYDLSKDIIPEPVQKSVEKESFTIEKYGVDIKITKLASYDITGKVEAIKDFSTNFLSNFFSFNSGDMTNYISPRDLTLSWGELALDENTNGITANQNVLNGARVVVFSWSGKLREKYGDEYLYSHVSNNHIITLNDDLKRQLMKIKTTDIVRIKGYLVDVECSNGIKWGPSSLVRNDTGLHCCEILYAEDIVIMKK